MLFNFTNGKHENRDSGLVHMTIKQVDKTRYRKHLNRVIILCIAGLIIGSLGVAQLLIYLFPDYDGQHFHWNLTGVVVSVAVIAWILHKLREHPYMTEVSYVWELKQGLNQITRKMSALKTAAQQGDVNAMLALQYSYAGSRLLWELDDNTIVMDELAIAQAELDQWAQQYKLNLEPNNYDPSTLKNY